MQLHSCPKASYLKVSLVNTLDDVEEEALDGEFTGESVSSSDDSSANAFDPLEYCAYCEL